MGVQIIMGWIVAVDHERPTVKCLGKKIGTSDLEKTIKNNMNLFSRPHLL